MSRRRHVVRQGECLSSLAARTGTTVAALWDHPDNAALRRRRDNPNILMPGDVVSLPAGQPPRHEVARGGTHRFDVELETVLLRLALVDRPPGEGSSVGRADTSGTERVYEDPQAAPEGEDEPLAGIAYELEVLGRVIAGTTDGEGMLAERVPATAERGRLVLEPGTDRERSIDLRIGHLDPLDEPSGAAQRLHNLGFSAQGDDGLALALEAFQRKHGLEPTGELDETTRGKLRDVSGS